MDQSIDPWNTPEQLPDYLQEERDVYCVLKHFARNVLCWTTLLELHRDELTHENEGAMPKAFSSGFLQATARGHSGKRSPRTKGAPCRRPAKRCRHRTKSPRDLVSIRRRRRRSRERPPADSARPMTRPENATSRPYRAKSGSRCRSQLPPPPRTRSGMLRTYVLYHALATASRHRQKEAGL